MRVNRELLLNACYLNVRYDVYILLFVSKTLNIVACVILCFLHYINWIVKQISFFLIVRNFNGMRVSNLF